MWEDEMKLSAKYRALRLFTDNHALACCRRSFQIEAEKPKKIVRRKPRKRPRLFTDRTKENVIGF